MLLLQQEGTLQERMPIKAEVISGKYTKGDRVATHPNRDREGRRQWDRTCNLGRRKRLLYLFLHDPTITQFRRARDWKRGIWAYTKTIKRILSEQRLDYPGHSVHS